MDSAAPADAGTLTPEDLLHLAASDTVTIGAHTVDHVRLGDRPAQEQRDTVAGSKGELEQSTGRSVSHFAYPFGGRDDFDDRSVDAVRSAAFETACTTIPGTARSSTDPYRLPRRLVMDWGRSRFESEDATMETGVRSCRTVRQSRSSSAHTQKIAGCSSRRRSPRSRLGPRRRPRSSSGIDHNEKLLRKSEEHFGEARHAGGGAADRPGQ